MMSPEHAAASALTGNTLPQGMSLATNAGTQSQKRTDRVQVKPLILTLILLVLC